ncbi:MAG: hypothetical protein WAT39_02425 [Planctomycetota bacterium]
MSLPVSVASILSQHVTLELESIDRMYCNVMVPQLQYERGISALFRFHRGHQFASSALMQPMTDAFVKAIEKSLPLVSRRLQARAHQPRERLVHQPRGLHVWLRRSRRNCALASPCSSA